MGPASSTLKLWQWSLWAHFKGIVMAPALTIPEL
jgi:hypothetical protein